LPHRGSATPEAASAREQLSTFLKSHGHKVEEQAFNCPKTYGWELLGMSALLAAGGLWPNGFIALLGLYAFWAYFSGWPLPWSRLVDRHPSANLLATAGEGRRTLVIMAHLDTAKSFILYEPNLVKSFRLNFQVTAAAAILTVPFAFFWTPGARLLGIYFVAQMALLFFRERSADYVNGANDNASGVAVATQLFLDLSPTLMHDWKLMLAITGGEEVGAKGARTLVKSGKVPKNALILNIDSVGAGRLHFAEGEGMLRYLPFKGRLVEAARKLPGAVPVKYKLAYFDTLPFARAKYDCVTLTRLEDGVPVNWHWKTDTPDALDMEALARTYAYARGLAERVGAALRSPTQV